MKFLKVISLTALLPLIFLCHCTKPTGPVTTSSPGTGSYSLIVTAYVQGADEGGGQFETTFLVTIRNLLNQPVNDAIVSINHAQLGMMILPLDSLSPGAYKKIIPDYHFGTYILDVRRGGDFISDASVFGPDIHSITYPTTSDTLRQDSSFTILWSRTYKADTTKIETRDFGPQQTEDDGNFTVPPSFKPRDDQRIRIWRKNGITLAGGRPDSHFEVEIRNSVEPIVVR